MAAGAANPIISRELNKPWNRTGNPLAYKIWNAPIIVYPGILSVCGEKSIFTKKT